MYSIYLPPGVASASKVDKNRNALYLLVLEDNFVLAMEEPDQHGVFYDLSLVVSFIRLACLVTGDAVQAELTAWTNLATVDPDRPRPTNGARVV